LYLLVVEIILFQRSRSARFEFLVVEFWMFVLRKNPGLVLDPLKSLNRRFDRPWHLTDDQHLLHAKLQIRVALNTFIALILFISLIDGPLCLNGFGDNL
jgi:hypothetical protein